MAASWEVEQIEASRDTDTLEGIISQLGRHPPWMGPGSGRIRGTRSLRIPAIFRLKSVLRVKAFVSGVHSRRMANDGIFVLDRCYPFKNTDLANIWPAMFRRAKVVGPTF